MTTTTTTKPRIRVMQGAAKGNWFFYLGRTCILVAGQDIRGGFEDAPYKLFLEGRANATVLAYCQVITVLGGDHGMRIVSDPRGFDLCALSEHSWTKLMNEACIAASESGADREGDFNMDEFIENFAQCRAYEYANGEIV